MKYELKLEVCCGDMQSVLAAKLRTLKGDRQEVFAKLVKFGAGRGYSYNQIKAFYDNIGRG